MTNSYRRENPLRALVPTAAFIRVPTYCVTAAPGAALTLRRGFACMLPGLITLTQLFFSNSINKLVNLITLQANLYYIFNERYFYLIFKIGNGGNGKKAYIKYGKITVVEQPLLLLLQLILYIFTSILSG